MPRFLAKLILANALAGTCAWAGDLHQLCASAFHALLTQPTAPAGESARALAKKIAKPYPYLVALLEVEPHRAGAILLKGPWPEELQAFNDRIAAEGEIQLPSQSLLAFLFDPITRAVEYFFHGGSKAKASLFVDSKARSWQETVSLLAENGLRPQPLAVSKASGRVKDVPFGEFNYSGEPYDYDQLPPSVKKLRTTSQEIFFGRTAKSPEEARKIVERYFTEGVERNAKSGHFDVHRHQENAQSGTFDGTMTYDSASSGFSNGSEVFQEAEIFAKRSLHGVVFIMDTQGQQILNLSVFHKDVRKKDNVYNWEHEVLTKGGRPPKRVRAAVVYDNGRPVAFYSNPNYEPGGGK